MGDLGPAAQDLLDEVVECTLDPRRRLLRGRELGLEVEVAEPTGKDPPFLVLVPVVVAMPP
jgi:hypothetical protein